MVRLLRIVLLAMLNLPPRTAAAAFLLSLMPSFSAAQTPDVSGIWHWAGDPAASFQLHLSQTANNDVMGHFIKFDLKPENDLSWYVSGTVSATGRLEMTRRIPVKEFPTRKDREAAWKKYGRPGDPLHVVGDVILQLSRDGRTLSTSCEDCTYQIPVASGGVATMGAFAMEMGRVGPLIAHPYSRYHRLFIAAGSGTGNLATKRFSTNIFNYFFAMPTRDGTSNELIDATIYSDLPGLGKMHIWKRPVQSIEFPDEREVPTVDNVLRHIRSLVARVGEFDRVLITLSGHGGQDLRDEYKPVLESMHQNYCALRASGRSLAPFGEYFFAELNAGRVPRIGGVEYFSEYFQIANGQNLYDYQLAAALQPLVDQKIPTTIVVGACWGSGFRDNFPNKGSIKVLGLSVSYACSESLRDPLRIMMDKIDWKNIDAASNTATVSAQDVSVLITRAWGLRTGVPPDNTIRVQEWYPPGYMDLQCPR